MPIVDLSSIGLDGQQAFATRMSTLAQARVNDASATGKELENKEEDRIGKLNDIAANALRGGKVDSQDPDTAAARMTSLAEPLEMVGNIYLTGGAISKGTELMTKASEIRKRESDIKNDGFTAQKNRLSNIVAGADIVGKWIGGARNQQEWELGMQEVGAALERGDFVMQPEMYEKIKAMPYDPDAAAYFAEQSISAKEKAELELRERTEVRTTDNAAVAQSQAATRIRLQEARDADMKQNRDRLTKIAGDRVAALAGGSGTVTKDQTDVIKNTLRSEVFKNLTLKASDGDKDFQSAVDYITMTAKAEIKDNKGIDWYTAVQRSILRAKAAGTVAEVVQPKDGFLGMWGDPKPSKGKVAIDPPRAKDGNVDAAKLVKGTYYRMKDGTMGKWNGTGIVVD